MARAAFGRWTAKSVSALAACAAVFASSAVCSTAHAQSRGLLGGTDQLQLAPIAQQPVTDQQPTPDGQQAPPASGDPTAGNTGPGAGGPTLNLGGNSAPVVPGQANQPAKDQPGAEKKKQGMTIYDRLAGSALYVMTSASLNTLAPSYQADWDPTVATYALFLPRFALSKDWQLRGRIGVNFEYTNSDTTTRRHEPELIDGGLQLFYRGIPAIGGKVKLTPFVSTLFPTSKASQARTMIFTPGIGVQGAMPIEHFLGGEAMAIASFTYGRPFYRYKTPNGLGDRPYQFNCTGATDCGGQFSGVSNARDTFATSLIFAATWWKLSPGALMLLSNQIAYAAQGSTGPLANGQDPSRARASTFFALWLDAEVSDWITPEIGYQQSRSLRNADGSWGNPFFSNKQDQLLYVAVNLQLDSILKKIAGEEGKAGVVRAKVKPQPQPIRFY